MNAELTPMTVISAFEAILARAYVQAGQLTGNDTDATALLVSALEDAFGAHPTRMPSAGELERRMGQGLGAQAA